MEVQTWGWVALILALISTTFGVYCFVTTVVACLLFILAFLKLLYVKQGSVEKFCSHCAGNPLTTDMIIEGGLPRVVKQLSSPRKTPKTDSRVTGSDLIDSSLQEILGYIIRDYILPWYSLISGDSEFPEVSARQTAQTFAINISNRVKDIDWIPYLTTRFVDDVATHLRLFKQARTKMRMKEKPKTHLPTREQRISPRKQMSHKRNKSETDVNWYNLKEKRASEFSVGNAKTHEKRETLEDCFFDLECQMENSLICREIVSTDVNKEKEFLCEIVEILLYILLPESDFQCRPLRYVLREIFANYVISPLFTLLSDPDYINQAIIWLCLRDASLPSDIFLTVLRITDNSNELKATKDLVNKEIQQLRSRDSGGDSDSTVKQQLSSLYYLLKLIDNRLSKIDDIIPLSTDLEMQMENARRIDLTLEQIVKNNVALSYFIDFASSQGHVKDLYFFLNLEGWRVSVKKQLSDIEQSKSKGTGDSAIHESIRSTALSIFEQYLGDKSTNRIQMKQSLVQSLHFRIRNLNDPPASNWFDDVERVIYERMEMEFLPAFKQSRAYVKLLHELDLVVQNAGEEDAISVHSNDSLEEQTTSKTTSAEMATLTDGSGKSVKHARSFSDITAFQGSTTDGARVQEVPKREQSLKTGDYTVSVTIIQTGIVCEKGKTFGVYAIRVSKQYETGYLEEWHIYRRYSDFHDLYTKVKERHSDLSKLSFPAKKTFHNMERSVLERRMKMLGDYMQQLCQPNVIKNHAGLQELIDTFLEQGDYDRATGGPIMSTITTLVNPLKTGMKTITKMPVQIIHTVDEVVGGISKVFTTKTGRVPETTKVGASIEETDDNIPLRIMLLLMDEVFDLKSRNQWLRRRIVTLLRQIVRTMFGDIVNRRILDYVSFITSPKNVAHYLHLFKQSFWPRGMKSEKRAERDEATRIRTRVGAKVALLSCVTDELKHIIGSETTRRGVLTIFDLLQRPILNRRLLYVLFEGVLVTLFPEKDMLKLIQILHSKSKQEQTSADTQAFR